MVIHQRSTSNYLLLAYRYAWFCPLTCYNVWKENQITCLLFQEKKSVYLNADLQLDWLMVDSHWTFGLFTSSLLFYALDLSSSYWRHLTNLFCQFILNADDTFRTAICGWSVRSIKQYPEILLFFLLLCAKIFKGFILHLYICRLTFLVAEACVIAGAKKNAYHTKYRDMILAENFTCETLRKGVFVAGAVFIVATMILNVYFYMYFTKAITQPAHKANRTSSNVGMAGYA